MRHTLEPVFGIFPKWRALLRTATAGDGSAFQVLEVPAPVGSDAAAGLLVSTDDDRISVSFDVYQSHFDDWAGPAGALDFIRQLVTEHVAVVSWWSGGRWCGCGRLTAGQRPEVPSWAANMAVDGIRVRSWRGALNADVACGQSPAARSSS